jgi:hypothetical protein
MAPYVPSAWDHRLENIQLTGQYQYPLVRGDLKQVVLVMLSLINDITSVGQDRLIAAWRRWWQLQRLTRWS